MCGEDVELKSSRSRRSRLGSGGAGELEKKVLLGVIEVQACISSCSEALCEQMNGEGGSRSCFPPCPRFLACFLPLKRLW
jgi:hypothetical protein